MSDIAKLVDKKLVFSGQIFEVVQQTMKSGDGRQKIFEKAIRSPGVRLIIVDKKKQKILLTREFRYEINDFDYRLPGGKVCDTILEYKEILEQNLLEKSVTEAVRREGREEAGIIAEEISLFCVSKSGGPTVEWDLYYYVISGFRDSDQALEFGENISTAWYDFKEAIGLCLEGEMKEDRSVGVLLKYFRSLKLI